MDEVKGTDNVKNTKNMNLNILVINKTNMHMYGI